MRASAVHRFISAHFRAPSGLNGIKRVQCRCIPLQILAKVCSVVYKDAAEYARYGVRSAVATLGTDLITRWLTLQLSNTQKTEEAISALCLRQTKAIITEAKVIITDCQAACRAY